MRHPSIFIIICLLILLNITPLQASILYTVPIDPSSGEGEIGWPEEVKGPEGELFLEALSNYKRGKYKEALNKLRSVIERYPGSKSVPDAMIGTGRINLEMGLATEAAGTFKRVIREYPSGTQGVKAQYLLALAYERDGKFKEALFEYRILSMRYPEKMEKERVFGMGNIFFALHKFDEAKRLYEDGLKRWPAYVKGQPDILFKYSECQFQNGGFLKAREGFLTFYNLYPKGKGAGFALSRVGDTYILEQKDVVAEKIYKNVLALFPEDDNSMTSKLARGKVLEVQGKYQDALNIYNELHDKNESLDKTDGLLNKEVFRSFSNLTERIGEEIEGRLGRHDYFGAVKAYQSYYKRFIDRISDEGLLMKIAEAHRRLLLYKEASEIYQEIIERNGENKKIALFKVGEMYSHMGDYSRAVETFGMYIADYPGSEKVVSARVFMGEALYNLKEYEKAANYFYAAVKEAPYRNPSVYIKLSSILLRSGQYEDSANILRDWLKHLSKEQDPGLLPVAYITLGNAYYGLGRYQDALDAYRAGLNDVDIKDESEMVQFMMGNCLLRLNKRDDAKRVFLKLSEDSKGLIKQFSEERLKDIGLRISFIYADR